MNCHEMLTHFKITGGAICQASRENAPSHRPDTPRHLRLPDTFPSGTGVGQVCTERDLPSKSYGVSLGA